MAGMEEGAIISAISMTSAKLTLLDEKIAKVDARISALETEKAAHVGKESRGGRSEEQRLEFSKVEEKLDVQFKLLSALCTGRGELLKKENGLTSDLRQLRGVYLIMLLLVTQWTTLRATLFPRPYFPASHPF